MGKKAKQSFAEVFYQSMTGRIDELAGMQPKDNFYINPSLTTTIRDLLSEQGREERTAEFLLRTFDNLLECKASVRVYLLINEALRDAKTHKACDRLINGLEVFLSQECMVAARPDTHKFAAPSFV